MLVLETMDHALRTWMEYKEHHQSAMYWSRARRAYMAIRKLPEMSAVPEELYRQMKREFEDSGFDTWTP